MSPSQTFALLAYSAAGAGESIWRRASRGRFGGTGVPIVVILIYMFPGTLLEGIAMFPPGAMPGS